MSSIQLQALQAEQIMNWYTLFSKTTGQFILQEEVTLLTGDHY